MTDSGAPAPAAKATKTPKAKVPRAKPNHPPTNEMVQTAIKDLKERGGSSLIAIKKYIAANYKVDVQKLAPFIKRAVISGVTSGALVQTKGKGASGSFKLPVAAKPVKKAAKSPKKPAAAKKTPKKAAAKKPAAKKAAKSPAKAKKPKAKPTKVKKAKSPAKKPKAPKPKKSPAKKPASKKAAAKK